MNEAKAELRFWKSAKNGKSSKVVARKDQI